MQAAPVLSKQDLAQILMTRADDIDNGEPPCISMQEILKLKKGSKMPSPYDIAFAEFKAGVMPYVLERKTPDGGVITVDISSLYNPYCLE